MNNSVHEIYKSLNSNDPIDKVILDILKEEQSRPDSIVAEFGIKTDKYVICEVIREIFYMTKDVNIMKRCIIAQLMAKKMSRKLEEYFQKTQRQKTKTNWTQEKFFPTNPNKNRKDIGYQKEVIVKDEKNGGS